jgi:hypothetical protein
VISFKNKFIFIHIPKTGGTSLELTLEDSSCICKRNQWSSTPQGFNAPLNHLGIDQLREGNFIPPNEVDDFFKFAFVRNSWDRVISECFCSHIQAIFKDCQNIEDKIVKVCSLSQKGYGNHCKSQLYFIQTSPTGSIGVDHIGRFENLQQDFDIICDQISIPTQTLPYPHKTKRKHYSEYYTTLTKELVGEKYKDEIEYFGYEFEDKT